MRDSATAAFRHANTPLERSQLLPCVVQAAWRLGKWEDVRNQLATCEYPSSSMTTWNSGYAAYDGFLSPAHATPRCDTSLMTSDDLYETELAHALLCLHDGRADAISTHASAARKALIPQIAAAGMDSYSRAYGSLVKLQVLQELQAAAPLLLAIASRRDEDKGLALVSSDQAKAKEAVSQLRGMVSHWKDRLSFVADAPQFLEPILAMRTAILRMAENASSDLDWQVSNRSSCAGLESASTDLRELTSLGLKQTWLRQAKSARAAGHFESASHALAQASVHDSYAAGLVAAKMAWEAGRPHEAILRLQQQRKSLASLTTKGGSSQYSELMAQTLNRLARYTEEQVGDAEHEEIKRMHAEAAKCCPNTEKVHYHAGRFHDNVLARALAVARRREVTKLGQMGSRSAFRKEPVKTSERNGKMLAAFTTHMPNVIKCYVLSLKRGMNHAALAVSRMLALWLEFADLQCQAYGGAGQSASSARLHSYADREEGIHAQMEHLWSQLPTHQWLPEVALLVSRTTIANSRARPIIHNLLSVLLATYPAQLSWSIVPAALSTLSERKKQGESIVAQAKHKLMGQQQQVQDDGRNHHDVLSIAKRLVEQLKKLSNDNSMQKREVHIRMSSRWSTLYRMQNLPLVIPTHANLTAARPEDGQAMRDYEPFSESVVYIDSWSDGVEVMGSLQRPKKVCIRGSDGGEYNFLCKPKDDLRKDARVIEVLTAANRMLHKSSNCRRRKLSVKCYAVVPLDQECGLIEWVPNMEQIRTIVKTYWEAYKHPFNVGQIRNRHAAVMAHQTDRKGQLSSLIQQLMVELPPVLHYWFSDTFKSPSAWFEARLGFTRSCAVMSMIGYSVGLGDRHLENILIDTTTGSLMHVDFACLFDHGLNLETPEKVPFRLTPNLIHTFGVCGADGVFRRVCELTLRELRNNKLTLLTILSTLRHDPLVEWTKRNVQEDQAGTRESDEAAMELEKVDLKLQGINQMRSPVPQSVDGQVARLINDATDVNNLCQMYVWWMPWC